MRVDIRRIIDINKATDAFATLHGASGTNDEDRKKAIKACINVIHISTEIRLASRRGLKAALDREPIAVAPYKILPGALEAVKKVYRARLEVFNSY